MRSEYATVTIIFKCKTKGRNHKITFEKFIDGAFVRIHLCRDNKSKLGLWQFQGIAECTYGCSRDIHIVCVYISRCRVIYTFSQTSLQEGGQEAGQ